MNDHDWLQDVAFDDPIWLDLLVDDELTAAQRTELIRYVAEHNLWQAVATTFLDAQVLASTVPSVPPAASATAQTAAAQSSKFNWRLLCAMVACLVAGLLLGHLIPGQGTSPVGTTESAGLLAAGSEGPEEPQSPAESTEDPVVARRLALPALFQARDTLDEAVFYADYSVPQFLLDALIIAGHDVSLEHDFIGFTQSADDPAAVPVNVIRVRKYGHVLASSDNLRRDPEIPLP